MGKLDPVLSGSRGLAFAALAACSLAACSLTVSGGSGDAAPAEKPQIVDVSLVAPPSARDGGAVEADAGDAGAVEASRSAARDALACDPSASGGSCPMALEIKFRLPPEQFVCKAYLRFQGDGTEDGVDRGYLVERVFGQGDEPQTAHVDALVPPNMIRRGALLTYSVRLVSGAGAESDPATLPLSLE